MVQTNGDGKGGREIKNIEARERKIYAEKAQERKSE